MYWWHMLKVVREGFAKKIGEHIATITISSGTVVLPIGIAWLTVPERYTFELSRLQMTIAIATTLIVTILIVLMTRALTRRVMYSSAKVLEVDELQKDILRLLWCTEGACLSVEKIKLILLEESNPSRVVLACQRLQTYELIAFNSYDPGSLVQLTNDGREYADKHRLNNAASIIRRAAASVTEETEITERAKLAAIASQVKGQ